MSNDVFFWKSPQFKFAFNQRERHLTRYAGDFVSYVQLELLTTMNLLTSTSNNDVVKSSESIWEGVQLLKKRQEYFQPENLGRLHRWLLDMGERQWAWPTTKKLYRQFTLQSRLSWGDYVRIINVGMRHSCMDRMGEDHPLFVLAEHANNPTVIWDQLWTLIGGQLQTKTQEFMREPLDHILSYVGSRPTVSKMDKRYRSGDYRRTSLWRIERILDGILFSGLLDEVSPEALKIVRAYETIRERALEIYMPEVKKYSGAHLL